MRRVFVHLLVVCDLSNRCYTCSAYDCDILKYSKFDIIRVTNDVTNGAIMSRSSGMVNIVERVETYLAYTSLLKDLNSLN